MSAKRSLRHSTEKSLPETEEDTHKEEKSQLCDGILKLEPSKSGSSNPKRQEAAGAAPPLFDEKG